MKRHVTATLLFVCCCYAIHAQLHPVQQKAIVLKRMIELQHYSPKPVDDSFSVAVFRKILNAADPRRLFFTVQEYNQLTPLSGKIDDEIKGNGWSFYDKFSVLYKLALTRADSIIGKLAQKKFDFTAAEAITSGRRNSYDFRFATDVAGLTNRWSRYLKYHILDNAYDMMAADTIKKTTLKATIAAKESIIKERIKKTEQRSIQRILDYPAGFSAAVTELYLNALASTFDPHTNYFSPEGKEELHAELSTEGFYFGIEFEETEDGKVIVENLTPGGAAWKSGVVNKGDEVISLQWEGKESQDMEGATLEEVYAVIDQSAHDRLLFRLRKQDGTMTDILLRKEKMENEDNIVKGFILKGEKKIGYILLPGFYSDWGDDAASGCANDVAKEIVRLKKENIDGLIVDVRYNGGGSVGEALEMSGIFIEEGPMALQKDKAGKLVTLKDPNRGTIYDGPMVLMVNGQSASASELLAATLQDYNRAVIVGSKTFGKATGQIILPMDTTLVNRPSSAVNNKSDIVKVTVMKLFRVNGKTAQQIGVTPDVDLPDAFAGMELGERYEEFALQADTVKKNNYYKPLAYLPGSELSRRSASRVAMNAEFLLIKKIADETRKMVLAGTKTMPLQVDDFEKWAKQEEANLDIMKGVGNADNNFVVENHSADKLLIQNDAYAKETNASWLKNLAEDIYIHESFLILTDLINIQKNIIKN
jgi:carboxyl-terminal processing protease